MQDPRTTSAIRIVLADDDDDIRQLVRINLELDGRFAVVGESRDGLETISVIRHAEPDIALIDVDMPELGGLEAVRRIRRVRPDVTVVVYSASGHEAAAADALEAGAHGFLDKAFDITSVARRVAALHSDAPAASSAT